MLTEKQKLEVLTNLGTELNQVKDLDILMEHILTEARRVVNADAGSIYIRDKSQLHFTYTQNATLQKRLPRGVKLIYNTFAIPADESSIAGYSAITGKTLNIPDVYNLDNAVPYSFSRQFDETSGYKTHSVLAIPLKTLREEVIGVLQVINSQDEQGGIIPFSKEDERMMDHFASMATMALERAQMTRTLILRMIKMAELRDPKETGAHVNRVASYSVEIYERWAEENSIPAEEIRSKRDVLRMAAMLHDVGKIAISDQILKKPGRLTEEEYEIMKHHTFFGARLFIDRKSDFDEAAAEVALNHHEWWNGKGYPGHVDLAATGPGLSFSVQQLEPRGKRADEIPLFGRIVAIADVYDALSTKRAYKEAWAEADILTTMEQGAGQQFDPNLIEVFFSSLDVFRSIQHRYPDNEEYAGCDEDPSFPPILI
ncbi:MAG: HD domain-containing protein [Syntrophobacterales bacterium]|jgi:HD-GYP domain-containing protein (c-di-GMP phosphodiesterase class II)